MSKLTSLRCTKHGKRPISISKFYIASDVSVFSALGYIPICKDCLYKMAEDYYDRYKNEKVAIYLICRKIDVAFDNNIFESSLKKWGSNIRKVFQTYMTQYNSLGQGNNAQLPFDEGEHIDINNLLDGEKTKGENVDEDGIKLENDVKMSEEDIEAKEEVISLLGYDPFEGYAESDQKFLYNDLLSYFGDEDVLEDQYLISQLLQIVNNNNQIRKIDYLISQYTADTELLINNETKVKSLNSIKKDIVANNDKIAKENRISVKNREGSNIKKSSLTVMMEYLRSIGLEEAEVDYYDQKKAYGMQRAADISMKAMAEQIQFDENDINEIIIEQRKMIKEMEDKILDLEEENRKLYVEIENYKTKISE